jgi:Spy/CpxP family protein refolding chaperone
MNIKKIVLLGVFLGLISTNALAQQEGNKQMMSSIGACMSMNFSNCPQYMKLNEAQKAEVKKIVDDFKKEVMPLKKDLMDKMSSLKDQMMQSDLNEKIIDKTTKEIAALHDQILTEYVNTMVYIKKTTGAVFIESNEWIEKMLPQD